MAKKNKNTSGRAYKHRGRFEQISIYFIKLLRMFVYQKDWVVLPLSALIAGMVALVIRHGFAVNMDGTLKGAFALSCVGIWNGCFNSIQVVCRERNVVKREHRSGMHISSYLTAHAMYQALLCLAQTALTMYILLWTGVHLDGAGVITPYMIVDIGISIFLITYAADLLSLMISCFVRNTTVAMTVMPFVLIFQLVFSGGIFTSLPKWAGPISDFTLSKYGLNCIAAQADYNSLPMSIGWQLIKKSKDTVVIPAQNMDEFLDFINHPELKLLFSQELLKKESIPDITLDNIIQELGEDEVKELVTAKVSEASYNPNFESTVENVADAWINIIFAGFMYFVLAVIALEFIDKDKR